MSYFSGVNKTVSTSLPIEALSWIEEYRRRKNYKTRAEALRDLIFLGLDQTRVSNSYNQTKALNHLENEMNQEGE